jgi:hypothetical protein
MQYFDLCVRAKNNNNNNNKAKHRPALYVRTKAGKTFKKDSKDHKNIVKK